jgi:transcriptional regulator with XRE-family HTH domain
MTNETTPNALQALIAEHLANTADTVADVAARGGLPRQTVSGLLNRTETGGMPRRATLERLAVGLGLSLSTVTDAAAQAAVPASTKAPLDHRITVLVEVARGLPASQVDVLLATARALTRAGDTP